MQEISAQQMVFSRVEPAYSPKNESGFQAVYTSAGLTTDEIALIEARVSCYQHPTEQQFARKQFFRLPSGKIALTSTIAVESDPIITDKDRRSGAFIAHCLIFLPSDFQKILNNPFVIFDQFHFLKTPQEMVQAFNQQTGKEPPCKFSDQPTERQLDATVWAQASNILAKIEQLRDAKDKQDVLLFLGSQEQIEQILRTFIELAPFDLRLLCTFTTNIDSCRIQPGDYWAAGASILPDGRYDTVRLSGMSALPFDRPAKPADLYARWLAHVCQNLPPKNYREITSAQVINAAFRNKRAIPNYVDEATCKTVYEIHQNEVLDSIKKIICLSLSQKLSGMAIDLLVESSNFKQLLTIPATGRIQDEVLASLCRQVILKFRSGFEGFEKNDWEVLGNYGEKVKDYLLVFWASGMQKKAKHCQSALELLSRDDFQTAIALMNTPIQPVFFIAKKHVNSFLKAFDPLCTSVSNDEFNKVVASIHAAGAVAALGGLARGVGMLDNKHLTELEDILRKSNKLAPEFARGLQTQRKKLGRPAGLAGLFYKEK